MCGIAGFVQPGLQEQQAEAVLLRMLDTIAHRGPDDQGRWLDAPAGVALGHRRLAVVELSAAGHQPMASADGRFEIIFNGEIYNHAALRGQLERAGAMPAGGWRGHADTETLLACIAAWGVTQALQATVGMFALALWDRRDRVLTLARDRLGEKPLYYGWQDDAFLFGSELKALRAHPRFAARPDWTAARALLEMAYIPGPGCIWQGIAKLPPGCTLTLHQRDVADAPLARTRFLLVARRQRPAWPASALRRQLRRRRGPARGTRAPGSAAAVPGGRAGRRISLRRHRLVDGGGDDAAGRQRPRHDILDRHARSGDGRIRAGRCRCPPSGHRACRPRHSAERSAGP